MYAFRNGIIAKIIDEQRRVRDKGACETGTGDKYSISQVETLPAFRR